MQDLRRLTVAILCALLAILQDVRGEVVRIATWNLEWFPGGKPNSSQAERLVHMSAARDALIDIRPDVLCLQEVRDWDSVAELVSILPNFQPLVVSRFREMGSSGPLSIQQLAIASNRPAEAAWSESFKPSPATPPRGFSFAAIRHGKTVAPGLFGAFQEQQRRSHNEHRQARGGRTPTACSRCRNGERLLRERKNRYGYCWRFQHRSHGRPVRLGGNLRVAEGEVCLVLGKMSRYPNA